MLHQASNSPAPPPEQGEEQSLDQKLPDDLKTIRPQRCPDRDLALPSGGAGEKEIGHIRAGDEQNERDRRAQDKERRAHVADHIGLQIDRALRPAGVGVGILFRQLRGDGLQIRRRPSQVDAWFQPTDYGKEVGATAVEVIHGRAGEERLERGDVIDVVALNGKLPTTRHHTGDRINMVGRLDLSADNVWIAGKTLLPKGIADHYDPRGAGLFILARKTTTKQRLRAQHRENIRAGSEARHIG